MCVLSASGMEEHEVIQVISLLSVKSLKAPMKMQQKCYLLKPSPGFIN